ncbi:MAG TPA: hypothetical protein VL635_09670, partial [Trinickia sp.]|nr:hypothetical protein [Trinickia sp.]
LPLVIANAEEPVGLLRRSAGEPSEAVEALADILREATHADARRPRPKSRKAARATPQPTKRAR